MNDTENLKETKQKNVQDLEINVPLPCQRKYVKGTYSLGQMSVEVYDIFINVYFYCLNNYYRDKQRSINYIYTALLSKVHTSSNSQKVITLKVWHF